MSLRMDVVPAEVDALEAKWWAEFAYLEDEIAWVHPPEVRRSLRKHYLRRIITEIPLNGIIVDFGCGVGWLAILLAQLGAKRVIGVDNAPAQIELAKRAAKQASVENIVSFELGLDDATCRAADVVIFHGILHHLTWREFDTLFEDLHAKLGPKTCVLICEPVLGSKDYGFWSIPLKLVGRVARMRYQSAEELRLRRELGRRGEGPRLPGYGVAPKETPFRVNEIENRLSREFDVISEGPVLFRSLEVAIEFLLLTKTYPRSGRFCLRWLLPVYMFWERFSFNFVPRALWQGWVFCLYKAVPR
jgi:2-polyprenyl-3-methyl-5-hydroxy-6-metoxy-1,4-benzoquinol methylase